MGQEAKVTKKELIRKLKALAERGEEYERQSAQAMIDKLIKKYGLEDEDLNVEITSEFCFEYKGEEERKLLLQTIYKIIGSLHGSYRHTHGKGSRSKIYLTCKNNEGIQIGIEYEFYRELWKEEKQFFLDCFIQKHNIFYISSDNRKCEYVDHETMMRMSMVMSAMQDKKITPLLDDKNGI